MFPFLHVFICLSVFKKYNKTPKYDNEINNELLVKQVKEGVKRNCEQGVEEFRRPL